MGNYWTVLIVILSLKLISSSLVPNTAVIANELSIRFHVEPEDVILNRNSQFTWNCNASSNSPVTIEWRKKGTLDALTTDSERRVYVTPDGALQFNKVRADKDPGIYYCLAKDHYGSIRSKFAKLQVSQMAKEFDSIPSKNITLYRGGQLYLACTIQAVPSAQIWWLRNKKNLSESEDKRINIDILTGNLLIKNMKLRDSGRYRCVALHQDRKKFSPDVFVSVHKLADKSAIPAILYSPRNVTAFVNDYLVLTVAADMPVYVQWAFSNTAGHHYQPPINYIPIPLDGHNQHSIRNIRSAHDGIWTCTVIAIHNHKSVKCPPTYLKVITSPRIVCYIRHFTFKFGMQGTIKTVNLTSIVRPVGGSLSYECKVIGQPKTKLQWLHNGNPMQYNYPSSRYQLTRKTTSTGSNDNEVISFRMNQIEGKDRGYYQIGATNEAGSSLSMPFMLTVEEYPVPNPPQNLRSVSVTAYTVTLAWNASPSNLNPEIYYTIDFWPVDNPALIYSQTTSRSEESVAIKKDLKPWRKYTFVVKAWNYRTASQPSNKLIVKTAEDAPTASPRTLKLSLVSLSILVKWERVDPLYENGKITRYYISCTDIGTGTNNVYDTPSYLKNFKIPDVLPDSLYSIKVAAATSVGLGPFSRTEQIKTSSEDIRNTFASVNLKILFINASTITFTWDVENESKQHLIGYQLDYRPYGISKSKETLMLSSKAINYSLIGLQSLTEYDISISGMYKTANESGYGPSAYRIISTTPGNISISAPNRIKDISANTIESRSLKVVWQRPKIANSVTLTRYLLSYRSISRNNIGNLTMINVERDTNYTRINNLRPYTSYEIYVSYFVYSRYSGELPSKASKSVIIQTKQDAPESPPIIDSVKELSSGMISVTWNVPKLANGIITLYKIKYKSESETIWNKESTKLNHIALRNIAPEEFYEFSIAAVTTAGVGPYSTIKIFLNKTEVPSFGLIVTRPVSTASSEAVTKKNIFQESLVIVGIVCGGICGIILLVIITLCTIRRFKCVELPVKKVTNIESVTIKKHDGITANSQNFQSRYPTAKVNKLQRCKSEGINSLQSGNRSEPLKDSQCKESERTKEKETTAALKSDDPNKSVSNSDITIHRNNLSS
ncbi:Protogenin [Trichoplax sp. H2]|nr:Protogenin [Trichoplax sp. H2]|eukprot:RDD39810.1 Protogenin [Trichoplax sp. H2]